MTIGMNLVGLSYDGNEFGDDFIVIIRRPYLIPPIQSQWSARGGETFDFFAGIQSGHGSIIVEFYIKAAEWRRKRQQLQGWLANNRKRPKKFIAVDMDDPDEKEWVIVVVPETATLEKGRKSTVVFSLVNQFWPFWITKNFVTENWPVTGTGETFTLSENTGNVPTNPVIRITPNVSKTGDYAWKMWRPVNNPTSVPWRDIAYDLAEDTPGTSAFNTAALINKTSISNRVNQVGGIGPTILLIPVDTAVGGGLNTGGGMCYSSTGEQIYYTEIIAGVMQVYDDGAGTTGRGWGGTTALTLADNTVLAQSDMMANCQDVRVLDENGNEVDCWIPNPNSAQTKVFINVTCPGKIELTLDENIANSGAVSSMKVKKNPANLAALQQLPSSFMVLVNDEPFYAAGEPPDTVFDVSIQRPTSVDLVNYKIINLKRVYAKYGESIASHSSGATIKHVPLQYWIVYGNPLADPQVVFNSREPLIDLDLSTNLHIIWNGVFKDNGSFRSMAINWGFINAVSKSPQTSVAYSESMGGYVDPAEVAGLKIAAFYFNDRWNQETAEGFIMFKHPAGWANIQFDDTLKRRTSTSWAKNVVVRVSPDNKTWVELWRETSPPSTAYVSFTTETSAIATSPVNQYLQVYFQGSTNAKPDSENDIEIGYADGRVIAANVLAGHLRPVMANYHFNLILTNQDTDQFFGIKTAFAVDETIVVDCAHRITYRESDGKSIPLVPGSTYPEIVGNDTWLYDDPRTVDVSVSFQYHGKDW